MASSSNNSTSDTTTTYFYNNHVPVLQDGTYEVEAEQTVSISNETQSTGGLNPSAVSPTINSQSVSFTVTGPRFQISPSLVHSVYPPIGAKGDFRATLPKLTLNRGTLPWERNAILGQNNGVDSPWLFLLLVTEKEAATTIKENKNVPLSTLANYFRSSESADNTPPLSSNDLSRYPKNINYLSVDSSLTYLFPSTAQELAYLSYARVKKGNTTDLGEEMAVLLGNRLPEPGKNSTVYLVSLENCYPSLTGGFDTLKDGTDFVLPYFYKWQFHTHSDKLYFIDDTIASNINRTLKAKKGSVTQVDFTGAENTLYAGTTKITSTAQLINAVEGKIVPTAPATAVSPAEKTYVEQLIEKMALLPETTFQSLLTHLPGGFGPLTLSPTKTSIECTGSVTLPFLQMKRVEGVEQMNSTKGWYRSPLAGTSIDVGNVLPGFPMVGGTMPVNSKQYLFTDKSSNQLDVTYAAAFELGKLTALDDVAFSTQFFQWKNQLAAATRMSELVNSPNYPKTGHLPFTPPSTDIPMPQQLIDKITSWKNLENIPFEYIIPEPELLPFESIRFFQLDNNWINAFLCGAFSVGHVAVDLSSTLQGCLMSDTVTGFFMNSFIISGWPDFITKAYPQSGTSSLSLVRKDDIDTNLRMYLVSGAFDELEFYLHPMKAHSGFVIDGNGNFAKEIITESTHAATKKKTYTTTQKELPSGTISSTTNVVDISKLLTTLGSPTIAKFAGMMLAATPRVVFKIGQPPS